MSMTTQPLDQAYRTFSCPQEGLDESFFALIAVEYARGATDRFTTGHTAVLHECSQGLVDVLGQWVRADIGVDEAWSPIFGQLGEILAGRSVLTPPEAAVRVALTLHEHGQSGTWSAVLPVARSMRFARWLLPAATSVGVTASGDQVVINLSGKDGDAGQRIDFRGGPGRWRTADDLVAYPVVPMDRRPLTFLPGEPLHAPEASFLRADVVDRSSWDELPDRYAAAFEIMRAAAPEYVRWVDTAVPYVIPLRGHGAQITSGSSKADPGCCHISLGSNPIALAEMLIHEATHQYYHLLTRVALVHDGTDRKLYYSPVKRRGRPVPYILLAYHAFANVLLFTRACMDAGIADPQHYLVANEADLVPQLAQLDEGLRRTDSLTTAGQALWRPLADRISGVRR